MSNGFGGVFKLDELLRALISGSAVFVVLMIIYIVIRITTVGLSENLSFGKTRYRPWFQRYDEYWVLILWFRITCGAIAIVCILVVLFAGKYLAITAGLPTLVAVFFASFWPLYRLKYQEERTRR
jgi:amino acid permease